VTERTRVLVLGASGMLGHRLAVRLGTEFPVAGTVRAHEPPPALARLAPGLHVFPDVHAEDTVALRRVMSEWSASVVVNCIGIVKQSRAASDPIASIRVNALLPHELHRLTAERGVRLIHISTDCVFSGRRGPYSESDVTYPEDLYGRTKLLGEVTGRGTLTLRASLIGREIEPAHHGLIEWFLAQRGHRVRGYDRALFSGLTTVAAADLIAKIIRDHRDLDGIWHASAEPISKYALLELVNRIYRLGIDIERDASVVVDRRLDSMRLRHHIGWRPPSWDDMIAAMHAEDTMYDAAERN